MPLSFLYLLLIILLFTVGVYLLAVLEYWSIYKRFELSKPARNALKLLSKEEIKTSNRDKVFYETAPVLFLAAGLLSAAVLPWASDMPLISMATGALFVNAAFAYIMVAMVMSGWAPNGVYSMIGGWRFLGQLIAYS